MIDVYVCTVRNHLWEKDIQQLIVRENNYSPNTLGTDYYIIDIEYEDDIEIKGRFDIVALRWNSESSSRKLSKHKKPVITIFEVKQGEDSISGKSSISKHINDFNKLANNPGEFIADMLRVFNQKRQLGLISNVEKYKEVIEVEETIDFVLLIANYKSASSILRRELEQIEEPCNLIYANAMGYGLYHKNIVSKEEFFERFDLK